MKLSGYAYYSRIKDPAPEEFVNNVDDPFTSPRQFCLDLVLDEESLELISANKAFRIKDGNDKIPGKYVKLSSKSPTQQHDDHDVDGLGPRRPKVVLADLTELEPKDIPLIGNGSKVNVIVSEVTPEKRRPYSILRKVQLIDLVPYVTGNDFDVVEGDTKETVTAKLKQANEEALTKALEE